MLPQDLNADLTTFGNAADLVQAVRSAESGVQAGWSLFNNCPHDPIQVDQAMEVMESALEELAWARLTASVSDVVVAVNPDVLAISAEWIPKHLFKSKHERRRQLR